jgi:molybdate transport system substrate-binding protein
MKLKSKVSALAMSMLLSMTMIGCSSEKVEEKETVELSISAAASLKEAMEELQEAYKQERDYVELVVNFASSGSLQQQIEQGAPCDVFISAGKKQMTALEEGGFLLEDTNKDLVKNDLVLVAPENSEVESMDDLTSDKVKFVGVGEPDSVPAGKYADEVLTNLNIKDSINDKLVFAKDVKEVLAWTQSGNADVGFVYYSDAINVEGVKIVAITDEDTHSPITYPVAVIKESSNSDEAKAFEEFLLSDTAQAIFEKYGYKSAK